MSVYFLVPCPRNKVLIKPNFFGDRRVLCTTTIIKIETTADILRRQATTDLTTLTITVRIMPPPAALTTKEQYGAYRGNIRLERSARGGTYFCGFMVLWCNRKFFFPCSRVTANVHPDRIPKRVNRPNTSITTRNNVCCPR